MKSTFVMPGGLFGATAPVWAAAADVAAMLKLAAASSCMTCHPIDPAPTARTACHPLARRGPMWRPNTGA